jgi:hypothetical protein
MTVINAVPQTLDLNLYAGDDFSLTLTITDESGAPYNLSGAMNAQVRKGHALELVATPAVNSVNPPSGVVYLYLSAVQTTALGEGGGRHSWDLQHTDTNGLVTTICKGGVSTALDITQLGVA